MTATSRIDLQGRTTGGPDSFGVMLGCLVPLDDRKRDLSAQIANRSFQQSGLACSRRANQVQGEGLALGQSVAIVLGQPIISFQNRLFQAYRRCQRCDTIFMIVRMMVRVALIRSRFGIGATTRLTHRQAPFP
jgi:hypothetical protein